MWQNVHTSNLSADAILYQNYSLCKCSKGVNRESFFQRTPFYFKAVPSVNALKMQITGSLKFWKRKIGITVRFEYMAIEGT
jgi:hypothetical protein